MNFSVKVDIAGHPYAFGGIAGIEIESFDINVVGSRIDMVISVGLEPSAVDTAGDVGEIKTPSAVTDISFHLGEIKGGNGKCFHRQVAQGKRTFERTCCSGGKIHFVMNTFAEAEGRRIDSRKNGIHVHFVLGTGHVDIPVEGHTVSYRRAAE